MFRQSNSKFAALDIQQRLLAVAIALAAALENRPVAAAEHLEIPKLLFQPSVNFVLSAGDVEKSKEFYGDFVSFEEL